MGTFSDRSVNNALIEAIPVIVWFADVCSAKCTHVGRTNGRVALEGLFPGLGKTHFVESASASAAAQLSEPRSSARVLIDSGAVIEI